MSMPSVNKINIKGKIKILLTFLPCIGEDTSDPVTIQTNQDSHVEPKEFFELSIVTADGDKISTELVWIRDDDGEACLFIYLLVCLFVCFILLQV